MTDLVAQQMELERLYSKNQLLPRIRSEFEGCTEIDFVGRIHACEIPLAFGIDVLTQMALHKRADVQTMLGLTYYHLKDGQATADLLWRCVEAQLCDWDVLTNKFVVIWELPQDVQDDLERFQYPMPMIVEPLEITDNSTSGYHLNQSSVILRNNHHDDDVCLDHLNRLNKIKMSVNIDVALLIKNSWRNLDKPKDGEEKGAYEARVRAFEKYDRVAKDVIGIMLNSGNEFHFTHRYDKRGRTYCQGYHLSTQGNAWNKACLEFTDKELVV